MKKNDDNNNNKIIQRPHALGLDICVREIFNFDNVICMCVCVCVFQDAMHHPLIVMTLGGVGLCLNAFVFVLIGGENYI